MKRSQEHRFEKIDDMFLCTMGVTQSRGFRWGRNVSDRRTNLSRGGKGGRLSHGSNGKKISLTAARKRHGFSISIQALQNKKRFLIFDLEIQGFGGEGKNGWGSGVYQNQS